MYRQVVKIGVVVGLVASQSLFALTLKETMILTLENNPQVQERLSNYNETREDLQIAKSGWLPKLDYIGSLGYERAKNIYTGREWENYRTFENTLLLTQNLFNGWNTTSQINLQEARMFAAAYNYVETVNRVGFNLVNFYIETIKNRELLKIANENIRINEEIYNKVDKLYQGGLTTKSEMEKAAASLALARSNKVVQENNLKDILYQFKYWYGREIDPDTLEEPDLALPMPDDAKSGREYAFAHNPSLLVQRFNVRAAKEEYSANRSGYFPSFDIRASTSWNYNAGNANAGHDNRYGISAVLTYNLFNGFADRASIQKSVSTIQREVQNRYDLLRKTEESFDLAWAAHTYLKKKLERLQEYKMHAVSTLRLYSKEYEMGRRSLLDLLSAQNDLINAKTQIVSTKYNYLFAKYRVLDAMGTMVPFVVGRIDQFNALVGLAENDARSKDTLPMGELEENDRALGHIVKSPR